MLKNFLILDIRFLHLYKVKYFLLVCGLPVHFLQCLLIIRSFKCFLHIYSFLYSFPLWFISGY